MRCHTQTPGLTPETLALQLQSHQSQRRALALKFINIADPCLANNNLGKSISLFNSHRLREALKLQSARMMEIGLGTPQAYFSELVDIFKYTFEVCAVLPPLALHLPQLGVFNN